MKKENLTEISLLSTRQNPAVSGILKELLVQLGVNPSDIFESSDRVNVKAATYIRSHEKALVLRDKIRRLRIENVAVRLKVLKPRDWRHKWKVDFKPFALTRKIDVVPMAQKKSFRPGRRIPIYIETANAFGSGLHETTRFMSMLIERCRGKFQSYIDIGTGTGILSLVALKSGACEVVGLDLDRRCLKAAKENLRENGHKFKKFFLTDVGTLKSSDQYDFAGANLITHELIRVKRALVSMVKPGGYLAISGIMDENLPAIRKAFRLLPLRCLKILKGKQWVALLYKKYARSKH